LSVGPHAMQALALPNQCQERRENKINGGIGEIYLVKTNEVPYEILTKIFSRLELYELVIISKVCSSWRAVSTCSHLWKGVALSISSLNESTMVFGDPTFKPLHKNKRMKLSVAFLNHYKCAFSNIKILNTNGALMEHHLVTVLNYLPNLNELILPDTDITSEILKRMILKYQRTLQIIDVSGNRFVNDDVVSALTRNCRNIKQINISSCMNVTSGSIVKLIQSRQLTHIGLQKMYNMTDLDLISIFDSFELNANYLQSIDLSFNNHLITQNVLERLCASLKHVTHPIHINVSSCEQLVRKDIELLQKRKPSAKIEHDTVLYDYSVSSIKSYLDYILAN